MILCCGEALIDMLPRNLADGSSGYLPVPGGSVFNVAIAIGRLGSRAGYFSALSTDEFGCLLRDALAQSNVDCSLCISTSRPTTLAFVTLEDNDASYTFYDEKSAGSMLREEELPKLREDISALYFGAISLIAEPCGSAYETLLMREAPMRVICLDPNIRPDFITDDKNHRARMWRMIAKSDILKMSDADLEWISDGKKPQAVIASWLSSGTSLVVITHGKNGATAYTPTLRLVVEPVAAQVVDTVGAGDSFGAGLMVGLDNCNLLDKSKIKNIDKANLSHALDLATKTAGFTVSNAGAVSPWRYMIDGN